MEETRLYRAATQMSPTIYKDFYKFYYAERLKVFRTISSIIGIALLAAVGFMLYTTVKTVWIALAAWIGLFLLVYPHMAYRRPYKQMKDKKQTTHFSFYENSLAEKTAGKESEYEYAKLLCVYETSKYIFIYHTIESVSIVVKSDVKEGADGLCALLKEKTNYKKVKR